MIGSRPAGLVDQPALLATYADRMQPNDTNCVFPLPEKSSYILMYTDLLS